MREPVSVGVYSTVSHEISEPVSVNPVFVSRVSPVESDISDMRAPESVGTISTGSIGRLSCTIEEDPESVISSAHTSDGINIFERKTASAISATMIRKCRDIKKVEKE